MHSDKQGPQRASAVRMEKVTTLEDVPQLLLADIVCRAFQDAGAALSARGTLSLVCRHERGLSVNNTLLLTLPRPATVPANWKGLAPCPELLSEHAHPVQT